MFSNTLIDRILKTTHGCDIDTITGFNFEEWGETDCIASLLALGLIQEIQPQEELPCLEPCECDECLLKIYYRSDVQSLLVCPYGSVESRSIPSESIRQFRFSRFHFLKWLASENQWECVDSKQNEVVTDIYKFAETSYSTFCVSICFATNTDHLSFTDRFHRLLDIASRHNPYLVLCNESPTIDIMDRSNLAKSAVYVYRIMDLLCEPYPSIDLGSVLSSLDQIQISDEAELILRRFPGHKIVKGFACELIGKAIQPHTMQLGRIQLFFLFALFNGKECGSGTHSYLFVTEQELSDRLIEWHNKGWIKLPSTRSVEVHKRLQTYWSRLLKDLSAKIKTRLFDRVRLNRDSVEFRLYLSRSQIQNLISDIDQAVLYSKDCLGKARESS